MINTGDQIGFEVGFVSPMTNGPLAPGAGQFTVVDAELPSTNCQWKRRGNTEDHCAALDARLVVGAVEGDKAEPSLCPCRMELVLFRRLCDRQIPKDRQRQHHEVQ
eukprot:749908-Hanusia_phi.AAC.4